MGGSGAALGGRVAVGAATALAVGSLMGGTLYVSSAASESLQVQLDETCGADAGLRLGTDDLATLPGFDALAERATFAQPPVATRVTAPLGYLRPGEQRATAPPRMVLMARDGQFDELGVAPPQPGELLVPEWAAADFPPVGAVVDVLPPDGVVILLPDGTVERPDFGTGPIAQLRVAGTYPEVPVRPEPSFWCGYRDLFRPNSQGDRPAPVALVVPPTLEPLPAGAAFGEWELRPDAEGLRRDQAVTLIGEYEDIRAAVRAGAEPEVGQHAPPTGSPEEPVGGIVTLVERAERVADVVARTIAPVRWTAAFAAGVLLFGAGVLVVRDQRRELRLRVLRGVGPAGIAAGQLRWLAPTVAVGGVVGAALAVAGVGVLGPTPEIEPGALVDAAVLGGIGTLGALALVAAVVGTTAAASVDAPAHRARRSWYVPEVTLVALAVWSFSRLDRIGGVRQVGDALRGGDLVAQAFPLLAALAAVALLARPARWLLRRARRTGGRLPDPVLLGWRRVTAEPAISVTIAAATALAVTFAVQATTLTDSVERLLDDKASVFVGSDLSVSVVDEPGTLAGLGSAATVVTRLDTDLGPVEVLGVDRATFASAAFWRGDAASEPLDALLAAIEPGSDGALPAVVVNADDETAAAIAAGLPLSRGRSLPVRPVATADFFPGIRSSTSLVVVDRAALLRSSDVAARTEVWVRAPHDATTQLLADGVRVTGSVSTDEIFDVSTFLSTKWGYAAFTALGAVIGVVTLLGQLLVLDARRSNRRVAHVLTRRMGLRRAGEGVAVGVEVGVPLVGGALVGLVVGWASAKLATTRLDSLRNLEPPALLVVDVRALGTAGVTVLGVIVVLSVVGLLGVVRTRAVEVMRAVSG